MLHTISGIISTLLVTSVFLAGVLSLFLATPLAIQIGFAVVFGVAVIAGLFVGYNNRNRLTAVTQRVTDLESDVEEIETRQDKQARRISQNEDDIEE